MGCKPPLLVLLCLSLLLGSSGARAEPLGAPPPAPGPALPPAAVVAPAAPVVRPPPAARRRGPGREGAVVMMAVGAGVFSVFYVISAATSSVQTGHGEFPAMAIPVAGPLWTGGRILGGLSPCGSDAACVLYSGILGAGGLGAIVDGVVQAGALAVLLAGGIIHARAPRPLTAMPLPLPLPGGGGLALGGTF